MLRHLLIIACFLYGNIFTQPLNYDLPCDAAILMNAETGIILYEKDPHALLYPASTTKVATALYVLKNKKESLSSIITAEQDAIATLTQEAKRKLNYTCPSYWLEPDGSHIGLKNEEKMGMVDLLKGMLIASGNDAANVIAHALGPTVPVFMDQVNAYLKEIGCRRTSYYNPHGLHHPQHKTTAYDLAVMTKEALKEPLFCDIVAQKNFLRPKTNKQEAITLLQTNRLLRPGPLHYSKAIGVKTGYHSLAKHAFIAAASSEGRTLIAVLLGYKDRKKIFEDAAKLFDTAFNQPKVRHAYLKEGKQTFSKEIERGTAPLQTFLKEALTLDYYPAEDPGAKCLLYWNVPALPILENQVVGELQLVGQEGIILKKAPLLALNDVQVKWSYKWGVMGLWIAGGGLCFLALCLFFSRK
ncbi:MAG: D-alanyl-D-alanine carboxypeptidase [Candidatus Protochlamydia sp.]|nr:D-alanyl-D-alanine carboxypeptidase [Candidatus Protochlamydia sp.]